VGGERAPVAQVDDAGGPVDLERGRLLRGQHLGAEPPRLVGRPLGELGAREALREAEVVLDPRALAGLAAGRLPLDQHGPQPLRRAVDGRRKTRGAAADDDQIVEGELGARVQAELLGELPVARRLEPRAVVEQHDRQPRRVCARAGDLDPRLLVALGVEPLVRDLVAGKEVADRVRVLGETVTDDANAGGRAVEGLPRLEQVGHHRVELLVRRLPRFLEVVVEADVVDRLDRRLGVGVRSQ